MPRGITFSRDNPSLAYVAESKGLRNVDFRAPSSSSSFALPATNSPYIDVQVASDDFASSLFITAHMDGTVRFHDSRQSAVPLLSLVTNESKKHAASCVRLDSRQYQLAINTEIPDAGLFVAPLHSIISAVPSSSSSSTVTISDLQESGHLRVMKETTNKSYLKNCEFINDDFITAGSDDGCMRIWHINTGFLGKNLGIHNVSRPVTNVAVPPPEAQHPNLPHFIAFSLDDHRIEICSAESLSSDDSAEVITNGKDLAAEIEVEERELVHGEEMLDDGDEEEEEEEEWRSDPLHLPDRQCSYSMGYAPRQKVFICKTCAQNRQSQAGAGSGSDSVDFEYSNGICTQCAIHCHADHAVFELGTRVSFRCDCGTGRTAGHPCCLDPEPRAEINEENLITHNFALPDRWCICDRAAVIESAEDVMTQCSSKCSDWFHGQCIGLANISDDQEYPPLICNACFDNYFSFLHRYPLETCLGRESQLAFALSAALKEQAGQSGPLSSSSASSSSAALPVIGRRLSDVVLLFPNWESLLTPEEIDRIHALAPPQSSSRQQQENSAITAPAPAAAASSSSSASPSEQQASSATPASSSSMAQPQEAAGSEEADIQAYIQALAQRDRASVERAFFSIVIRRSVSASGELRRATVTGSDFTTAMPAVQAMLRQRFQQYTEQQLQGKQK